jgi:hypothetical protein
LLELHARYGPVVRFAPDDLSYADARAWKEIHDYKKGRKENPKAKEIIPPAFNGTILCIPVFLQLLEADWMDRD